MKNIFVLLAVLVTSITSSALNLDRFHNRNFSVIGSGCDLHVEKSGNMFVFTNVIPGYKETDSDICGPQGNSRACNGASFALNCKSDGYCYDMNDPQALEVTLLQDGNIFINNSGKKLYLRSSTQYFFCRN